MDISKVVVPVAGWGTRSLPATKNVPKEILPVFRKPSIQYIVEEAIASGLSDVVFVNNQNKRIIEDHFDYNLALEQLLERKGQKELLHEVRKVAELALTPAVVGQDGFLTTHLVESALLPERALVEEFLGKPDDLIDTLGPAPIQQSSVRTPTTPGGASSAASSIPATCRKTNAPGRLRAAKANPWSRAKRQTMSTRSAWKPSCRCRPGCWRRQKCSSAWPRCGRPRSHRRAPWTWPTSPTTSWLAWTTARREASRRTR